LTIKIIWIRVLLEGVISELLPGVAASIDAEDRGSGGWFFLGALGALHEPEESKDVLQIRTPLKMGHDFNRVQ
jgi:hypothetical protein